MKLNQNVAELRNKWLHLQCPSHAESLNGLRMGGFIYYKA